MSTRLILAATLVGTFAAPVAADWIAIHQDPMVAPGMFQLYSPTATET